MLAKPKPVLLVSLIKTSNYIISLFVKQSILFLFEKTIANCYELE